MTLRFAGEMRCKKGKSAHGLCHHGGASGEGTDEWIYLATSLTVKAKLQLAQYECIKNQNIRILTSVSPKYSRMHAEAVDVCSLHNTCHTIRFFFLIRCVAEKNVLTSVVITCLGHNTK